MAKISTKAEKSKRFSTLKLDFGGEAFAIHTDIQLRSYHLFSLRHSPLQREKMGHQDKLHTFVSKSTQANTARSKAVFSRFSSVVIRHASLLSQLYAIIWRHAMVFHSWPAGSSLPRTSLQRAAVLCASMASPTSEGVWKLRRQAGYVWLSWKRPNAECKTKGFLLMINRG